MFFNALNKEIIFINKKLHCRIESGRVQSWFATNLFSGFTYSTANLLFDEICEIKMKLLEVKRDGVLVRIGDSMLEKFTKYWNICHLPMACTVFLDPRCKMKLF